jgi:hypothetical protein
MMNGRKGNKNIHKNKWRNKIIIIINKKMNVCQYYKKYPLNIFKISQ